MDFARVDFELFLVISSCQAESWALGSIVGLNRDFGHPGEAQEEGKDPQKGRPVGLGGTAAGCGWLWGSTGPPAWDEAKDYKSQLQVHATQ